MFQTKTKDLLNNSIECGHCPYLTLNDLYEMNFFPDLLIASTKVSRVGRVSRSKHNLPVFFRILARYKGEKLSKNCRKKSQTVSECISPPIRQRVMFLGRIP